MWRLTRRRFDAGSESPSATSPDCWPSCRTQNRNRSRWSRSHCAASGIRHSSHSRSASSACGAGQLVVADGGRGVGQERVDRPQRGAGARDSRRGRAYGASRSYAAAARSRVAQHERHLGRAAPVHHREPVVLRRGPRRARPRAPRRLLGQPGHSQNITTAEATIGSGSSSTRPSSAGAPPSSRPCHSCRRDQRTQLGEPRPGLHPQLRTRRWVAPSRASSASSNRPASPARACSSASQRRAAGRAGAAARPGSRAGQAAPAHICVHLAAARRAPRRSASAATTHARSSPSRAADLGRLQPAGASRCSRGGRAARSPRTRSHGVRAAARRRRAAGPWRGPRSTSASRSASVARVVEPRRPARASPGSGSSLLAGRQPVQRAAQGGDHHRSWSAPWPARLPQRADGHRRRRIGQPADVVELVGDLDGRASPCPAG